jgi:oligopeptide transport system substrate-binding protein
MHFRQKRPLYTRCSAFLAGLLCLVLLGCQTPPAEHRADQEFTMNLGTEPPDLDPIRVTDLTSINVVGNLMWGLTRFDRLGRVIPAMAQRWQRQGNTYTFYLNPLARWSDGKPVTAQNFVDGWQRALTASNGAEYAFFLFDVARARDYYDGKLTDFTQVGVRAVNDHTLQVTLARPVAFFPALVASPVAFPIRKDVVARYGDRFTEAGHFVSNGPYQLTAWVHEDHLRMTPNPHFRPRTRVSVNMRMVNDANTSVVMYETGELDFIETPSTIPAFDVRRLKKRPDYHTGPLHVISYFGFNTQKPPFDDVRVRRAFAMTLNRDYYPRLLQSGQVPIQGFITPGLIGHNPKRGLGFNPVEARRLLAEAGYPNGQGFPPVTLGFRSLYDVRKEAEIAQYLWQKHLNVTVRLENMDWKVFLNRLKTDPPHLYRLNWYVDYPDADSFMNLFLAENGNNYTRWHDAEYDQWVRQAATVSDVATRTRLYDLAQKRLLEEAVALVPIYASEKGYLLNPRFTGLTVNALNLLDLSGLSSSPQVF